MQHKSKMKDKNVTKNPVTIGNKYLKWFFIILMYAQFYSRNVKKQPAGRVEAIVLKNHVIVTIKETKR